MMRWLTAGTCALALLGCGGDEKDSATECAPGIAANAVQPCTCPDGVTSGNQLCQADGLFAACAPCTAVAPTGGTGATGGTMAPIGGTGAAGTPVPGGSGGVGGTGVDASMEDDAGSVDSGTGVDAGDAGGGGGQNEACVGGASCSGSLVCYTFGNYCSEPCSGDSECSGLTGATYTCYTMDGVCRVQCDSANGNADCPSGMECMDVGGGNERCVLP